MQKTRSLIKNSKTPNDVVDGLTLLHHAIKCGDAESVENLIKKGADIYTKKCNEATPIHYAIKLKQNECLKVMISNKCDVNFKEDGFSLIFTAIDNDNIDALKMLIDAGADVSMTSNSGEIPLFRSIDRKFSKMTEILLANGSPTSVGLKHAITYAIERGDRESFRLILINHPDNQLFIDANGQSVLEIARNNSDPSFELLLLIDGRKPNSTEDADFIEILKEIIKKEMNDERKFFVQKPRSIINIKEILERVKLTEHKCVRFGELIRMRIAEVKNVFHILRSKKEEKSPLEANFDEMVDKWEAKIEKSEALYSEIRTRLHTPESKVALEKLDEYIKERKYFFFDLLKKTEILRIQNDKTKKDVERYQKLIDTLPLLLNWDKSHTFPFQKEVVEFSRAVKIAYSNIADKEEAREIIGILKGLNTQIAETNPALFEVVEQK